MPVSTAPQRSEAWHEARKGRITASLAGAILGVDPYRGPLAAYNEIMGIKGQKQNVAMAWGVRNEEKARREYEAESGNIVAETGFWTHPYHGFLGASPDGTIGANGLVEIKCLGKLPEAIPPHYEVQMRIQLACTEREWCDFFVWMDNGHWLTRLTRDPRKEDELIDQLSAWYFEHIAKAVPPSRKRKP